jgi:hypothetical protein
MRKNTFLDNFCSYDTKLSFVPPRDVVVIALHNRIYSSLRYIYFAFCKVINLINLF